MKYKFLIPIICIGFSIACVSEKEEMIIVAKSYKEPIDPAPLNEDWSQVQKGLQASIVSIGKRFTKSEIPKITPQNTWETDVWKGERVSTQMVLWSKDSITKAQIEKNDFISESGDKIDSDNIEIQFVKYVITDEFAGGCGYRKPEDFDASLAADALEPLSTYAMKANEARPVWITINTPPQTNPGRYRSNIVLKIEGQKSKEFELILNVIDKTLPNAKDWEFHLDLWQNPYAIARYHDVEAWSQAHWDLLKPIMKRLANAGQKVITVSLNKRPWGGQTYDQFESMIGWIKKEDGSWSYDYTIFDKWVQFMMELGIDNQISCYSMVPWGNELYYFDNQEGNEIKVIAPPGTKEYDAIWKPFLIDFKEHLVSKGWNNITRIAMDERGPKEMKAMLELINEIAPEFGVSLADNHKSYKQYPNELKDMSVAFGHPVDEEDLVIRKQNGYISTHYVCCSDQFPNTFTFSDPMEGIFIGWYSMAAKFDGFLRWAYNSWVENPLQDSRFRSWPAGDTYLVYPSNRSSIRFETLRDGIEDAEKIRILREDLAAKNMTTELEQLNQIVSGFNFVTKPDNLEELISKGKKTLNELAKKSVE